MKEKLTFLRNFLLGGRQFSVHKRIMRYVLIGALLPMLTITVISLYGMYQLQRMIHERGLELAETSAFHAENYAKEYASTRMRAILGAKVHHVEAELDNIAKDTRHLASQMTYIMQHPAEYPPRMLMHPRYTTVYAGTPYLFYSRGTEEKITPTVQQEMALAGNFADMLGAAAASQPGFLDMCYAGSKYGYAVRLEMLPGPGQPLTFSGDFMRSYDPRTRLWYHIAQNAAAPVFTDMYKGTKDNACITCAMPYYDLQGMAGVIGMDYNLSVVVQDLNNGALWENGFNFAVDNKGQVIFSSRNDGTLSVQDEGVDVRALVREMNRTWFTEEDKTDENGRPKDKTGLIAAIDAMLNDEIGIKSVKVDGEDYILAYEPLKTVDWSFGTAVSQKDLLAPGDSAREDMGAEIRHFNVMINVLFAILFLIAISGSAATLYILYYVSDKVAARFVKPIHILADGVREIATGNFDKRLTLQTGDELEHLANSFNSMTEELNTYTQNLTQAAAERERIATELSVAKEIQEGILPRNFPRQSRYSLYATMRTAKEVGGDFYDFYPLDDNHVMITIADVSGKGIGAALFMTAAKTVLQNFALTALGQDDLTVPMEKANERLCRDNEAMMFVTVFMGLLNLSTGKFIFVNGGHNPPLIYRQATGRYEYMEVNKNFVLGAMEDIPFKQQEITLNSGDRLFLYTDGVTEALNEKQELYSEARLLDTLNESGMAGKTDQALLIAMQKSIDEYAGGAEQSDDITMMSVSFTGKNET